MSSNGLPRNYGKVPNKHIKGHVLGGQNGGPTITNLLILNLFFIFFNFFLIYIFYFPSIFLKFFKTRHILIYNMVISIDLKSFDTSIFKIIFEIINFFNITLLDLSLI